MEDDEGGLIVKDANGNLLADGDTVTLVKDLKVKGTSTTLKVGTKIKGIRLVAGDHEVDCKGLFFEESLIPNKKPSDLNIKPDGLRSLSASLFQDSVDLVL